MFDVEWEPGRISWYVDRRLIHTENDWYSATEGQGKITYPAPFDPVSYTHLDVYKRQEGKLAAIAVSGPFGAVKEQCSCLLYTSRCV